MNLGYAARGLSVAFAVLLAACTGDNDGTGLLSTDTSSTMTPTLTIAGPDSVVSGTSQAYTVTALDATGDPDSGVSVTLTASLGTLSLSSTSTTTDTNGQLAFTLSASTTSTTGTVTPVTGTSTLTAKATVGTTALTATKSVMLTPTVFQFTSPNKGIKVALNTLEPLVLQWTSNGVAVSAPVTFTAKIGTLVDAAGDAASTVTVNTDSSGLAHLQAVSSTSGSETITAVDQTGMFTTTLALTYVGQPASFTSTAATPISAASGASTISAKVVDSTGNPVSGATVTFGISSSPSAGTLSPTTSTTSTSGIATAIYSANGATGTAVISVTVGTLPVQDVTITINS